MLGKRSRTSGGFSLIEVLITVLVVSVGLLSVAGLQAISKKSNFDSVQRNAAAALAQEILEKIRANRSAHTAYVLNFDGMSLPPKSVDCTAGAAAPCTVAQLAGFDLYNIGQDMIGASETAGTTANTGGLSSPSVCIAEIKQCVYLVSVAWRGLTPVSSIPTSSATDPANNPCGSGNNAYVPTTGPTGSLNKNMTMRRILVVEGEVRDPPTC